MDLYKALWSRIGGRPWTYIIRDFYHKHPVIVGFLTLGIGVILGHIFWGTKYIENQQGEDNANGNTS